MSSDLIRLGDIAVKITKGTTPTTYGKNFTETGVNFFKVETLTEDGSFIKNKIVYIDEGTHQNLLKRSQIEKGDILLTMAGAIGRVALVEDDSLVPANTNQAICIIRVTSDNWDNHFLKYYLKSPFAKNQIIGGTVQTAQPNLSLSEISNIKIPRISVDKQEKIAKILGDLDQKIKLNRKVNETLEQIGQVLFKKYFIEYSLDSEMTIGEVATVIDCLHSKKPELTKENTGFIFLQLNNILDNGILDLSTKYYISKDDYIRWTSRIEVKENDFVITNVGRSGAVAKIPQGVTAAMGRNMTAVRLKDDFNFPGFLSFALNSSWMREQIESKLDHGTILSALNVKSIPTLKLPGSKDLVSKYEHDFLSLRTRIESNHLESSICANLRDSLLPKLMNGQINV